MKTSQTGSGDADATGKRLRGRPLVSVIAAGALAAGGLLAVSMTAASAQATDHAAHQPAAPVPAATAPAVPTSPADPTGPTASADPADGHHPGMDDKYSTAYRERNWTPTEYDTCTAELHASYNIVGPDGKIYPTWHPAQVTDPATGKLCSFGHEHGADPATSDIYDWVVAHLSPEHDDGGTGHGTGVGHSDGAEPGIPFGYASEALMMYGEEHEGMAMRHEDNAGHKIFVANDVQLIDENRDWLTVPGAGATQEIVTCDFLIKQHQGSWSPDATSNNAHEAIYASRCSDGTEIISTTLSKFGNANEFHQNCGTLGPVATKGSKLPAGYGGSRQIPDAACVTAHATGSAASLWGMYELWKGENVISAADGTRLAHFDPWFGLRNPSRYYDPANSTETSNGISRPVDLAWGEGAATTYPWSTVAASAPLDWRDPASPFDGAQRDFYLNQNSVSAAAPATLYTDPYGAGGSVGEFTGSIKQHLVSGTATTSATLSTQKFDTAADFGKNNGVHAPN